LMYINISGYINIYLKQEDRFRNDRAG